MKAASDDIEKGRAADAEAIRRVTAGGRPFTVPAFCLALAPLLEGIDKSSVRRGRPKKPDKRPVALGGVPVPGSSSRKQEGLLPPRRGPFKKLTSAPSSATVFP